MADLSVKFAGKKLRSPIGMSSFAPIMPYLTPQIYADWHLRLVEKGSAWVSTGLVMTEREKPKGVYTSYKFRSIRSREPFAYEGLLVITDAYKVAVRFNLMLETVNILKPKLPKGVPIVVNVIGPGADVEGWAKHCKEIEQAGADILELNASCPLSGSKAKATAEFKKGELSELAGALLGDSPQLLFPIVEACRKAVKIPVGVKVTTETGFPRLVGIAEGIKDAGAAFITGINAPITVNPPDIYKDGQGTYTGMKENVISGACGPWDRYLAYRNAATISMFVPGIDLSAIGGLVEPEHIVEVMMLGAKTCQISSGIFWRGFDIIPHMLDWLNNYMDEMGYKTTSDFIGAAIKHFKPIEELNWRPEDFVSTVDDKKCIRCGICTNNLCIARTMKENPKRVEIDSRHCNGCGLCEATCPANAISLVEQKHPVLGVSIFE